jgi:hypothetical protein
VNGPRPPFLFLYAEKDITACDKLSQEMTRALQRSKNEAGFHLVRDRNHGSIMGRLPEKDDPAGQALLEFIGKHSGERKGQGKTTQDGKQVRRLIEQLNSAKFAARDAAAKALRQIGEPAVAALRETVQGATMLEVRRRAEAVLRAIQQDKLDRLIKQLDSPESSERDAAAKGLRHIGEPALPVLQEATRSNKRPALQRRAEDVMQAIQADAFQQVLKKATHQEVKKDYKKAAEILNRFIDEQKGQLAGNATTGDIPFLTEAYMRLARVYKKLGNPLGAANAYDRATYYSNYNNEKRGQIESECTQLVAGLMPEWERAAREKMARDPALKALAGKYPLVLLHSRRFAGGRYLQSAYSFIYETANEKEHYNDVQVLFDNGPGDRKIQVNMVTNQRNTVDDLGNTDFTVDPVMKKARAEGVSREGVLAVSGHVYLEKVEDTNGNRFFVLFKVVAVDEQSQYMAFIWRRLPGGKMVRRNE